MKTLIVIGTVESIDKKPLICRKEIDMSIKEIVFKEYPLSLLEVTIMNNGMIVDGIQYEWDRLPIILTRSGKHVNRYRDFFEEKITISIESKEWEGL